MKLLNNESITYIDETTFNLWQRPSKLWLHKKHLEFPMQSTRASSITLIGALNTNLGLVHFQTVIGSNNKAIFKGFMADLIEKLGWRKKTLVMDNLAIHHCKETSDLIKQSKHSSIYTPPYSCSLNSIESLWHCIKVIWRNHLL